MKGSVPNGIYILFTGVLVGMVIIFAQVTSISDALETILQNTNQVPQATINHLIQLVGVMNEFPLIFETRNFLISWLHLNLNDLPTIEDFRTLVSVMSEAGGRGDGASDGTSPASLANFLTQINKPGPNK